MRVPDVQRIVLLELSKPCESGNHFPCDAFRYRTIVSLEKKGLVERYYYVSFAHGAVRLTEKGNNYLEELAQQI